MDVTTTRKGTNCVSRRQETEIQERSALAQVLKIRVWTMRCWLSHSAYTRIFKTCANADLSCISVSCLRDTQLVPFRVVVTSIIVCLLYTSDAADDLLCV